MRQLDIREIDNIIEKIKGKIPSKISYDRYISHPRYPYTYAWDFVRTHYEDFGFEEMPSRGEVSALFPEESQKRFIAGVLARAHYDIDL